MANRWENNGNSDRLYFWGSKITADGDCSHEIKRCLLLGRKVMTNLESMLKSRGITLLTKVHLGEGNGNPLQCSCLESPRDGRAWWAAVYGVAQSWTWLSNFLFTSFHSLEGLMLKVKFQYFGYLMWRADSLKKDLDAGKDWRQKKKGAAEDEMVGRHHWLHGHKFEQISTESRGQRSLACNSPWGHEELDLT